VLDARAEAVLGLADSSDEENPQPHDAAWKAHKDHQKYCEQKSEFLLDLADCDNNAEEMADAWSQKACELWGNSSDSDKECYHQLG
jgi:hypothetical protein